MERQRELKKSFYQDAIRQYLDWSGDFLPPLILYGSTTAERYCFYLTLLKEQRRKGDTRRIKIRALEKHSQPSEDELVILWNNPESLGNYEVPEQPFRNYALNIPYFREQDKNWSQERTC